MDASITEKLLDKIIIEFLDILNRYPTRLRKLKNYPVSLRACVNDVRSNKQRPAFL